MPAQTKWSGVQWCQYWNLSELNSVLNYCRTLYNFIELYINILVLLYYFFFFMSQEMETILILTKINITQNVKIGIMHNGISEMLNV